MYSKQDKLEAPYFVSTKIRCEVERNCSYNLLHSITRYELSKVAIVTGSSRGIGEAIAMEFAKAGYNLVINSRNKEGFLLVNRK
jgi:hypothetical protein